MATLLVMLRERGALSRKGFILEGSRLRSSESSKLFSADELQIIGSYRFEGTAKPG